MIGAVIILKPVQWFAEQINDLQSKSMDWFLYNGVRHERVNKKNKSNSHYLSKFIWYFFRNFPIEYDTRNLLQYLSFL